MGQTQLRVFFVFSTIYAFLLEKGEFCEGELQTGLQVAKLTGAKGLWGSEGV